jgi:hypothetical protein
MIILSPKGSVSVETVALMPPIGELSGRVVGILNNGHHNGTPVLEAMRDLLVDHHRAARVLFRTKPWISRPAPDEVLQELRGSCDVVIAGVGD